MTSSSRDDALISILRDFNLTLPRNAMEWRVPLEETRGYIQGITIGSVRLLCTDGIVAWFGHSDGSTLFGHMQHFVADREASPPRAGAKRTSKTSIDKAEKTKRALAELMALLGLEEGSV